MFGPRLTTSPFLETYAGQETPVPRTQAGPDPQELSRHFQSENKMAAENARASLLRLHFKVKFF